MTVYNCSCDSLYRKEKLSTLRRRMLVRMKYSAQAANPPPGKVEELNDYLMEAQRLCYEDYAGFRTERWFTWTMVAGERFYDFATNDEVTGGECSKPMQPEKVQWVGIERDGFWTGMERGISPAMYSNPTTQGFPTNYRIGQCLEIWPAPSDANLIRVFGNFGLLPFAADDDYTTIDPDVIFCRAMTNAKAARGDSDAGNYRAQEELLVMNFVADAHRGKRYIPRDMLNRYDNYNGISGPAGVRFTEDGAIRVVEP
jgi:hypothetical protein